MKTNNKSNQVDKRNLYLGFVLVVVLLLQGCCHPGKCKPALYGFEKLDSVIQALEIYKKHEGDYPDALNKLVPNYIASLPDLGQSNGKSNIKYLKESGKGYYDLHFSYYGPGFNQCNYDSIMREWKCGGFY